MTEEAVNALMSATSEEAWAQAGLFEPPTKHLIQHRRGKESLLFSLSTILLDPSPLPSFVTPPVVFSLVSSDPSPVIHPMDINYGPSTFGVFSKSSSIFGNFTAKTGSRRPFEKKLWPPNKARRP